MTLRPPPHGISGVILVQKLEALQALSVAAVDARPIIAEGAISCDLRVAQSFPRLDSGRGELQPAVLPLGVPLRGTGVGACLPLGFVHLALTAKYQLTTALARLRERGDPPRRVGEGFADLAPSKQPLTPGFAVPSPLGEGRYHTAAVP